ERFRSKHELSRMRPANHLIDIGIVEERQAAATEFFGMAERPEALGLGLGHEIRHEGTDARRAGIEFGFVGNDFLVDETPDLVANRTNMFGHLKHCLNLYWRDGGCVRAAHRRRGSSRPSYRRKRRYRDKERSRRSRWAAQAA